MVKAFLFDLDGTLLDTLDDIHSVVNGVFLNRGLAGRTRQEVRQAVGRGVEHLVRTLLPSRAGDSSFISEISDRIRDTYLERGSVMTRPYDGIPELLAALQERSIPMAVLTNKPQPSADEAVALYFPGIEFRTVRGARRGTPLKPDPEASLPVIEALGCNAGSVIMLGDSDVDMDTAVNAGMVPVGVSWGFRDRQLLLSHGARSIVDSPNEILALAEADTIGGR